RSVCGSRRGARGRACRVLCRAESSFSIAAIERPPVSGSARAGNSPAHAQSRRHLFLPGSTQGQSRLLALYRPGGKIGAGCYAPAWPISRIAESARRYLAHGMRCDPAEFPHVLRAHIKRTVFCISLLVTWAFMSRPAANTDTSLPAGTWYLNANNTRLTLQISGPPAGPLTASAIDESGGTARVDAITWEPAVGRLEFRRSGNGSWQWYSGTIVEGILVGRFSSSTDSRVKPPIVSFKYHVTGWNKEYFDRALTPRVYDILIGNRDRGTLRIDASTDSASGYVGRLKVYSTVSGSAAGEDLEYDLEVTHWDGTRISFIRHDRNSNQGFTGTVTGRSIGGTLASTAEAGSSEWGGVRAQVLAYGFGLPRDPVDRASWQE